jgi:hypothetical protein
MRGGQVHLTFQTLAILSSAGAAELMHGFARRARRFPLSAA